LIFPFFKKVTPDLGTVHSFLCPGHCGVGNAVNLTDGLDGLAIGPYSDASATFMLFCYLAGISALLLPQIPFVRGSAELTILCGALVGSASVSLVQPLSLRLYGGCGFLGRSALRLTIAVVDEAGISPRHRGRYLCHGGSLSHDSGDFLPVEREEGVSDGTIHHHFELKGWAEPKIIVRFWIIGIILGLVAISTLKLR